MYYLKNTIKILLLIYCITACTESASSGEQVYRSKCASCHMADGRGLSGLIPPLANSDYLEKHFEELVCIIRYGLKDTIQVNGKYYSEVMPPSYGINDVELVNLINFVQKKFLNKNNFVTLEDIKKQKLNCNNKKR